MFWCLGFRLFILYCKTGFQDVNKWNYWRKTSNLGFAISETSRDHNLTKKWDMRWWDDEALVRELCTHEILGGANNRGRCWFFDFFDMNLVQGSSNPIGRRQDRRDKRSISLGRLTITNRHLSQLKLLNKFEQHIWVQFVRTRTIIKSFSKLIHPNIFIKDLKNSILQLGKSASRRTQSHLVFSLAY